MKFTKQDLLTLLISLFLFASCKNPDGVGLDVDPSTAIEGTLVVSDVKTQIVEEAAVNTQGLSRYPLGYMKDPVFGETETSLAMDLYPPQSLTHDFGTAPILDSAILVLKIDTTSTLTKFYGDTLNSKYSIDVYQLANNVTDYKSSTVQAHKNTLLGNYTGKIYPNTKRKVFSVVTGKADTLITVPAQIRVPLDKNFIQTSLVNLAATNLTSNSKFLEVFKGFYAQVNKTSTTGVGGTAFINFSGNASYLQLVYKKTNTTSGTDTVSVNFPLGAGVVSNGVSIITGIAANIKHNRAGTPVQAQLDAPTASYQVTYLQGLAGLKTKLTFPGLDNFTTTYGKAVVNKAELVVELGAGTSSYPFLAAQRLSLYRWDIAEQPTNISDYISYANGNTPSLFGGYFDAIKNRYIFNITNYVQSLINKTETNYGTFLAPTSLTEFQTSPTAASAERTIIGAGTTTSNKIKLNIYYTKIN